MLFYIEGWSVQHAYIPVSGATVKSEATVLLWLVMHCLFQHTKGDFKSLVTILRSIPGLQDS